MTNVKVLSGKVVDRPTMTESNGVKYIGFVMSHRYGREQHQYMQFKCRMRGIKAEQFARCWHDNIMVVATGRSTSLSADVWPSDCTGSEVFSVDRFEIMRQAGD
jgi:hypothetical protein